MKKLLLITVGLFSGFLSYSAFANEIPESCKNVTNNIASKIISNGVDAKDFKLDVVAASDVTAEMGQIVGNCHGEAYQIVYTKGENINPEASSNDYAPSTQSVEIEESTVQPDVK